MEAILLEVGADQPSTTSDKEQALKKLESALTPAPPPLGMVGLRDTQFAVSAKRVLMAIRNDPADSALRQLV
jgi:hypothetical protein